MNTELILFLLSCAVVVSACRKSPVIVIDPSGAAPGDIVALRITNGSFAGEPVVKIGKEPAVVITASDTLVTFIVPSLEQQDTELSVNVVSNTVTTDFQVQASDTERLWFTLKGSTIIFKERQPSREDFVRDKGHSENKLLMEFFNSKGDLVALTYIDHPAMLEVLAEDGKSLSRVQRQGEVPFDVNIPVLEDLSKMRVSSLANTHDGKSTVIAEVNIPAR